MNAKELISELCRRELCGSPIFLDGGDHRIKLDSTAKLSIESGLLDNLDTHGRFWLMKALYNLHREADRAARESEAGKWINAAAHKRIKTRKCKGRVKVWIEPETAQPAAV